MQALHDLGEFSSNLKQYDHIEFPGVVPRTFTGAFIVYSVAFPFHAVVSGAVFLISYFAHAATLLRGSILTLLSRVSMGALSPPSAAFSNAPAVASLGKKFLGQYFCRGLLGMFSFGSCCHFAAAISKTFHSASKLKTGDIFLVLIALQFHLPFYMTRTLPNTFALIGSLHSHAYWLQGRPLYCLGIMTFMAVVFRCDMIILLGPLTLLMLISREVSFHDAAKVGISCGVVALFLTVSVDSYFWCQRTEVEGINSGKSKGSASAKPEFSSSYCGSSGWLWPEGTVLFFNTVENKSSDYGTMAWHWYFTSALPKSLHVSLLFALFGLSGLTYSVIFGSKNKIRINASACAKDLSSAVDPMTTRSFSIRKDFNLKLAYYLTPAIAFVALYSILPHKELRFIFPALPMLTMAAAIGIRNFIPSSDQTDTHGQSKNNNNPFLAKNSSSGENVLKSLVTGATELFYWILSHPALSRPNHGGNLVTADLLEAELMKSEAALPPTDSAVSSDPDANRSADRGIADDSTISGNRSPSKQGVPTIRANNWVSWPTLVRISVLSLLSLSGILSLLFLLAALDNYPGGVALAELHKLVDQTFTDGDTNGERKVIRVHIDVPAAISGVTRFGERRLTEGNVAIEYHKIERLSPERLLSSFDWIITANATMTYPRRKGLSPTIHLRKTVTGFSYIRINRADKDYMLGAIGLGPACSKVESTTTEDKNRNLLGLIEFVRAPKLYIVQLIK